MDGAVITSPGFITVVLAIVSVGVGAGDGSAQEVVLQLKASYAFIRPAP